MINNGIERINRFFIFLETRSNLIITSFVIGFIFLGLDMLYVTPKFEAAYHGLQYSILSNNPFDFSYVNPLRYRILPSLIGYLIFLRGNMFFIVPLIFALLFISSVYWIYRRKKYSPLDAILFTGLIAFSCTLYIQLVAPGYTDSIFYFFLFLSFAFVKDIIWCGVFFALAMLTHESSIFLLPGLLLYSGYIHNGNKSATLKQFFMLLIAIIPLLIYRYWVSKQITVEYDLNFYFSKKNILFSLKKAIPLMPAGAFYAFKLFWLFPIYTLCKTWKKREFKFFTIIIVIIIFDFIQLIIAFDITRMLCLGFPAILLSAEKIKEEWQSEKFTHFVLGLTILNFFIFQYFMSSDGLIPM